MTPRGLDCCGTHEIYKTVHLVYIENTYKRGVCTNPLARTAVIGNRLRVQSEGLSRRRNSGCSMDAFREIYAVMQEHTHAMLRKVSGMTDWSAQALVDIMKSFEDCLRRVVREHEKAVGPM